jgi:hypothetical protein
MDGGSDIGDLTIAIVDGNEALDPLLSGTVTIALVASAAPVSIVPTTTT